MNIYEGLLFLHGHVASAELARQLVEPEIVEPVVTRHACHEPPECAEDASLPS
ncbi:hypothetical protein [Stenotrophomonas oahuensis]|uniref:Uncharacterized protein n=1 Tax=Stenotrophomonas oahuensis TaxID=3003271 RepID=A0ABY9YQ83_9GAMM|nr:hypothetical protein [Stenotrophomonas sp. A5586]WNH52379.1 hypothetical protein PDM29_18930 [Stenotrophomonas sp. A5586]